MTDMPKEIAAWCLRPSEGDEFIHGGWSDDFVHKATRYTRTDTIQGWQPIETAPKDGTEILGMIAPKVLRLVWWFQRSHMTFGFCDENGKDVICTHWMPLPPVPTEV